MSRKTDSKALVEAMAKVVNNGSGFDRRMTPAQARKIREEDKRLLEERRANSMRRLLAKQYAPWIAAAVVHVVGGICWLIRWRIDSPTAVALAVLVVLVLASIAVLVGRRTKKWKGRVHFAAWLASSWLLWTAGTGPSWRAPLVLVLGTVLVSGRWWQAHRIPHPKAPSREVVPVPSQSIPVLWQQNIAAKDRCLPGTILSGEDAENPNYTRWTIDLVAGKQTPMQALCQVALIAGGLHTPVRQVVLEPDPDQDPNRVRLTIVKHSPIDKTMPYKGARIVGDQQHMIEVGPYGDGEGWARWRMWQPGEKPMTGSWLSGLIIAGTGVGKSRLMELLAAGYMASRSAVVWFVDPQSGASSPALKEMADWYVHSDSAGRMIATLERIAKAREKQMTVKGWSRFDPSPERPGIVVFLDEGHVTIKRHADRLEELARSTQKVGIGLVVLTQGGGLESLGKDILRASLLSNLIVMKTGSNQTKNLIPGLEMDPEALPKIKGFGYSVSMEGDRTAPFRAELVEDPKVWFERYGMPKLDPLSANAAGEDYQMRRETAVKEIEADRQWVEQMESGTWQPELNEPDLDDEGTTEPRAFQVVRFPSAVAPPEKPARERVLVAVAQGITRTAEIQREVGLSKSRCAEVLAQLLESRELERPTAGVYAIAGSASTPER